MVGGAVHCIGNWEGRVRPVYDPTRRGSPVNDELTGAVFKPPWHATGLGQAEQLAEELNREIPSNHVLAGCGVVAVAKRHDCDDVLFRIEGSPQRYALVHLTYRRKRET
jgi:hypothetical protein